ncbi:PEP-CTERM system TPR-repeat protein PrsT [Steroidobacter sp. S1-65]|uniref:PEP-CTERM system TPR-repeat protein PrsT n=1 Tax=Steroidobacter gossypii TaxID=2805490 RepID=A0ABS1WYY0_9GAMM|nr:XrtA/PEP-CTERM system TPR-repeat protein PrsT [Steroidobacter gossypii]MBM0106194.1 PEP-CTERM system TPR-repeat protein PrsT [Steroidobacter gossypii]
MQFPRVQGERLRASALALCLVTTLLALSGCDFLVSPQQRYERAQSQVAQGEYRGALVELKNALKKQPDLHEARALLAAVALWLGDPASAEAELNRLPETSDPSAHADLRLRIDLASGRPQAVLDKSASGSVAGVAPAKLSLYRGAALDALGRTAEAQQEYRAAVQSDPSLLDAQVGVIETTAALGDSDAALQAATQLTEQHPNSAIAWYAQGSLLARTGKTDEARTALLKARDLAGKQIEVSRQAALLSTLIELQLASRDVEGARSNLEAMNRIVGGSSLASLTAARVSMASNDYIAAAGELRRLVNSAPQFTAARYLLGVALVAQGNLEQASQELGRVVEQAPQNLEARQLLAQVRMRLHDPDGALRVLVPAIQANADNSRLAAIFDEARNQAGADASTIATLEEALRKAPDNANLQLQLANLYLQAGAPDKAVALLRRDQPSGPLDPRRESVLLQGIARSQGQAAANAHIDKLLARDSGPGIVSLVAGFHAREGNYDKSRTLLNAALARDPKQPELLFTLARVEWSDRKLDAARSALQRVIDGDPDNHPAQMLLVEMDIAQGAEQEAAARLENMRKADPKAIEPTLLLARLALRQNDPKRADELISAAVQVAPKRPEVLNTAGLLYLESGRFDQAAALFKDGVNVNGANPMLWLNLGRAQLGLDQKGPAREALEKALSLQPNWLPAVGALAFLEVQEGREAAALERIEGLKRTQPKDPAVLALEGEVYSALRRYEDAARSFDAASALRPSSELAIKSYQARLAGKLPDAIAPLERWSRDHPDNPGFNAVLADAYIKLGERQKAVQLYQRILERQPNSVAALNNLAWLYYELHDERALTTARRAYALAPQSAAIMDTLGWILVERGFVTEGLTLLERAATPKAGPEIQYHYAAALARSGAKDRARQRLSELLGNETTFASREAAQRLLGEL